MGWILLKLIDAYVTVIIIWAILSWVPYRPGGPTESVRKGLGAIVEPYIGIFRRFLPPMGGIDFSPVLAIIVLEFIGRALLRF
mgnify:FL=1